jgi:hypothetical protein
VSAIQESLRSHEWCRQVVDEQDPVQRAQAIANLRRMIDNERHSAHSSTDRNYLKVAEMILDFLEETFSSPQRPQQIQ